LVAGTSGATNWDGKVWGNRPAVARVGCFLSIGGAEAVDAGCMGKARTSMAGARRVMDPRDCNAFDWEIGHNRFGLH
jgi:hypothetical protein